jgi:hypothetical protein
LLIGVQLLAVSVFGQGNPFSRDNALDLLKARDQQLDNMELDYMRTSKMRTRSSGHEDGRYVYQAPWVVLQLRATQSSGVIAADLVLKIGDSELPVRVAGLVRPRKLPPQ